MSEVHPRDRVGVDFNVQAPELSKVLNVEPFSQAEDQMRANCRGHWWTHTASDQEIRITTDVCT
jgi:hypothetical protein